MSKSLKAPFPYFGGKSRVAPLVWERLGNVGNYVEPFAGSAAILLSRPHDLVPYQTELLNDLDGDITNFWRSIQQDPEGVVDGADYICSELDLHARAHRIEDTRDEFVEKMRYDMDFCDPERAGWWLYGMSLAVGNSFEKVRHCIPAYGVEGSGIHCHFPDERLSRNTIARHVQPLIDRLRSVRIACGDWKRVVTPAMLHMHRKNKVKGVFLDPPYLEGNQQYASGGTGSSLASEVLEWCKEMGNEPNLRIALCGYQGHYDELASYGWEILEWEAYGGYGKLAKDSKGRDNAKREVIWFSPNCVKPENQHTLFDLFPGNDDDE